MRRLSYASALSVSAISLAATGAALAAPAPGPGYGDGMVLQQGQPVTISGKAAPGARVTGMLGTVRAQATAAADGSFTIAFPAREASTAPVSLTLSDPTGSAALNDLLIGDVYLCSGQSNMELPVTRALNTMGELRQADDSGIRLLKIPQATASVEQDQFAQPVAWNPANADSVAEFSAACYFMAKQLRADHPDVPVGLIHSNWGGSAARAWLDPQSVENAYGAEAVAQLSLYDRDPMAAAQSFVPQWYDWWRQNDNGREPWTDPDSLEWQPVPQISFWNEWTGTGLDTDATANVWLRKSFTLSADQAASEGTLSIGSIDDLDLTWVNGHPVGYTFGWGVERHYRIPAEYLREGENEILIAANNSWDTGGFFAGPDRLFFETGPGQTIPLGSDWRYSVAPFDEVPPRAPWDANAGMGVMHNAMIAPLGPMRLAGVTWYQGESDARQPDYDKKLEMLFDGWRRQFGEQARVIVVQLANFGERTVQPQASSWADLRQEQLDAVVAASDAALVSAIDIGEPTDIHPANKNVLGKRLAMAAEGRPMPMPLSATMSDGIVTVRFSGIEGGLRAYGGPYALGVELCGEPQDSCRYALPALDGDTMRIDAGDGKPVTRVRHAWADAPVVNLYDARDLPVPGFELPIR